MVSEGKERTKSRRIPIKRNLDGSNSESLSDSDSNTSDPKRPRKRLSPRKSPFRKFNKVTTALREIALIMTSSMEQESSPNSLTNESIVNTCKGQIFKFGWLIEDISTAIDRNSKKIEESATDRMISNTRPIEFDRDNSTGIDEYIKEDPLIIQQFRKASVRVANIIKQAERMSYDSAINQAKLGKILADIKLDCEASLVNLKQTKEYFEQLGDSGLADAIASTSKTPPDPSAEI